MVELTFIFILLLLLSVVILFAYGAVAPQIPLRTWT